MRNKLGILLLLAAFIAAALPAASEVYAQQAVGGERIFGSDRYQTCINVSRFGWPVSSESGTVIIATGKDFPDALSAAPLAKKYNAPILLTESSVSDAPLLSEITRLKTKKAYIIGGTGVVSQELENKLKNMGITCVRLFGKDRYETSAAVANELGAASKIVVATGEDFPDALSIASWAAANGSPILLTDPKTLPSSIEDYIKKNNITQSYVIGGTGVVSDEVMSKLKNPQRIWGKDRYATNIAILKALSSDFNFSKMYLATGENFPDALSGSALASLTKSPIVLAGTGPLPETKTYIDSIKDKLNEVYILGGSGVVSDAAVEGIIPPVVAGVEIVLSSPSVVMNKEVKATANVKMIPSNAVKPAAAFTVGDASIARINSDGTITGLKLGNTRVTASVGGRSSSTNIFVKMDKLIVLDPGHGGSSTGAIPFAQDGVTKLLDYRESVLNLQMALKLKRKLEAVGAKVLMARSSDVNVSLDERTKYANDMNADYFISIHHDSAANKQAVGTTAYYNTDKPAAVQGKIVVVATGTGPVYDVDGKVLGNVAFGARYQYIDTFKDAQGNNYVRFIFNGHIAKAMTKEDYITIKDETLSTVARYSADMARRISSGMASLGMFNRGAINNDFAVNVGSKMPSVLIEVGYISNWDEFSRIRQDLFQEQATDKIAQAIIEFYQDSQNKPSSIPATF